MLQQIKQEIKQRRHEDNLTKSDLLALEKAFLRDRKICAKCGRTQELTVDHIVPRDILKQFGIDIDRTYIEENLQILCRICNTFKGNKLDFSNPKTKEILLRLLQRI